MKEGKKKKDNTLLKCFKAFGFSSGPEFKFQNLPPSLAFWNLLGPLHITGPGSEAGKVGTLGGVTVARGARRSWRPRMPSWSCLSLRARCTR